MEIEIVSSCENEISDEGYLITMARRSLNIDRLESKAWMLTAKTLFPTKFGIQFEAYEIEKMSNNSKEAAKYFSDLFRHFSNDPRLWHEVLSMMSALRSNNPDDGQNFLRDMFNNIPSEIQYELLLVTADRSEDTIDHCHLMLLLLKKFPDTMQQHGAKLVDTLMAAEKHSHGQNALNSFRRLLVCDLQPLLGACTSVILPPKQLHKILLKSVEFYICYIMTTAGNNPQNVTGTEGIIEDPWKNLFLVYDTIGQKLNWELCEIFSSYPLNKEQGYQKLMKFLTVCDERGQNSQQYVFCATLFLVNCLYDYNVYVNPGPAAQRGENDNNLVFVEVVPQDDRSSFISDSVLHKRGIKDILMYDRGNSKSPVIDNFILAYRCYEMFHTMDVYEREFSKLSQFLKLEQLLKGFLIDAALHRGRYVDCIQMLSGAEPSLKRSLRMACSNFFLQNYEAMYMDILSVVSLVSSFSSGGAITASCPVKTDGRCLNYIPIKKLPILQYCCKLMIYTLKRRLDSSSIESDLACGHILVLAQLDWPLEEKLFLEIIKKIKHQGCWTYHLFMKYIVNIDYLEEFMYLSTEHGGALTLDILPPSSSQILNHRRMSTRGVDKGAKEDFKMAMRRQTSRSQEPLDTLIAKFLSTEKRLLALNHL